MLKGFRTKLVSVFILVACASSNLTFAADTLPNLKGLSPVQASQKLDELFQIAKTSPERHPNLVQYFLDPKRVQEMYFEKPAKELALWQIEQTLSLSKASQVASNKNLPLNHVRPEVKELQSLIEQQFLGTKKISPLSGLSDQILNDLEHKLLTTPAETQLLQKSRASVRFQYNSAEHLVKASRLNLIEKLNAVKAFNQDEILPYISGLTEELPKTNRTNLFGALKPLNEKAIRDIEIFKRELMEAPPSVRARTIQYLYELNPPSPALARKLVLKDLQDHPIYRPVFDAFFEAYPKEVKAKIAGDIMSALNAENGVSLGTSSAKFSLKTMLETRGAFGVKMGQTIYSLRIAEGPIQEELGALLNAADRPTRAEVIERTLNAFQEAKIPVQSIDQVIGSGSVNYVVKATLLDPETKKPVEAIIRFQRTGVQQQALKENEYFSNALKKLMKHPNPEVRDLALKANIARQGAMKTLELGGSEIDLSLERNTFPEAQRIYSKSGNRTLSGYMIDVSQPRPEFQKLVKSELQSEVSIYSFEKNTSWEKVANKESKEVLRKIAKDIVSVEMDAILNGNFDKDGHAGNWLIDPERKKLIRIDTAQLTHIPKHELDKFKQGIKLIVNPYVTKYDAEKLSKALDGVLELDNGAPLWNRKMIDEIIHDPKLLSSQPENRLFVFRDLLEEKLKMPVRIRPHANDAMIAISKLKGFEEYMGKEQFKLLMAEKMFSIPELINAGTNFLRECTPQELMRAILMKPRQ